MYLFHTILISDSNFVIINSVIIVLLDGGL